MRGLLTLPDDVLQHVLARLPPHDVVRLVGPTCYRCYAIAASDELWQIMLARHFACVIDHAFHGKCPLPLAPLSWRAHFFSFSGTWMLRAKEDEGRILMVIGGHVYDATDYVEEHPGLPSFLMSAAGTDATTAFLLAGHSENARTILRGFAVPSLDPYQPRARAGGASIGGASSSSGCSSSESDRRVHCTSSIGGAYASIVGRSNAHAATGRLQRSLEILGVLLGSANGRRKVLEAIGSLLSAGIVDLERTGRDPVRNGGPTEGGGELSADLSDLAALKRPTAGSGIQRFLPVVWHLSCVELASFSWLHRQPTTPAAVLDASRAACED